MKGANVPRPWKKSEHPIPKTHPTARRWPKTVPLIPINQEPPSYGFESPLFGEYTLFWKDLKGKVRLQFEAHSLKSLFKDLTATPSTSSNTSSITASHRSVRILKTHRRLSYRHYNLIFFY